MSGIGVNNWDPGPNWRVQRRTWKREAVDPPSQGERNVDAGRALFSTSAMRLAQASPCSSRRARNDDHSRKFITEQPPGFFSASNSGRNGGNRRLIAGRVSRVVTCRGRSDEVRWRGGSEPLVCQAVKALGSLRFKFGNRTRPPTFLRDAA